MAQELEICSICRRVRDHEAGWIDLGTSMRRSGLPAPVIALTPGYCPDCDESYRLLMTYGRTDQPNQVRVA